MKHQMNYTTRILLIYLLVVVALCIMASCNPVKKVLQDTSKMKQVFDKGVELGWCVNDSVYISDTTIILDTLNVIETVSDTIQIGDSVWIDRVEYRTIHKTITIRDTTLVTDRTKENLLQNKLIDKTGELLKKVEELEQSQSETKEARKHRNKWRLYFFIALAAFTVFILRKPILKLIKPI